MIHCKFKDREELINFVNNTEFDGLLSSIENRFIKCIIGFADNCKVVYDYCDMRNVIMEEYKNTENEEISEELANEWIYDNSDSDYQEIVFTDNDFWYDEIGEERILPYKNYFIGINPLGILLLDSEKITNQNISEIESLLNEIELNYEIL